MTDTIQVKAHPRKKPASVLAYQALRDQKLEQLKRETEARAAFPIRDYVEAVESEEQKPRRLTFSLIFMPWNWRRG